MGDIRIGTSGWSYPAGEGTWNGLFYPAASGPGARVDELAYYAEHFDTVEVNSTFYGQPAAPDVPALGGADARHVPSSRSSCTRSSRTRRCTRQATGRRRTRQPARPACRASIPADLDQFRRGIDPIAGAGRIGALLAQFPPSFKDSPEARDYLDALLAAFRDYPVAVELRHRSWSDAQADTLALLNGHGAAWAQIDEPKFRFSIRQDHLPNVTSFYYMRLHGRNAAKWWTHERAEERYDYLYAPEEIRAFADTADAAGAVVRKLYLYLNNHFAAKSVANAVMIKQQLGQPITGTYPPAFVSRYPQLSGVVSVEQSGQADGGPWSLES